jgi:hypothetical protein
MDRRLEFLEHVEGKDFSVGLSIPAGPEAIRLIAPILSMVIAGPPERSRTRSPRWNEAAVWFCVAVFDRVEEKAGITKGIPSTIPSAIAWAIETCLLDASMLNSTA